MISQLVERARQDGKVLLLDGPVGTELGRRGVDLSPPLWSARALLGDEEILTAVHRESVSAGARVVTANTFRTTGRALGRAGIERPIEEAKRLTGLAVQIARSALPESGCWVAGSIAPLEDCYSPDLVPEEAALLEEHQRLANDLVTAGVDLILVETMNNMVEAVAATRTAGSALPEDEGPVWTSFVLNGRGELMSGEDLVTAARAVVDAGARAVLINCSSLEATTIGLEILASAVDVPVGAYANAGQPQKGDVIRDHVDPEIYLAAAIRWQELGATLIGTCCGTTAEHLGVLADRLPLVLPSALLSS